jgi:hypothetical protein
MGQPNTISVNPFSVCQLRPTLDNRSTIYFDDAHMAVVEEPLEKVEEALNSALNSSNP